MSIRSFADRGTEDIFEGVDTKKARGVCPEELWPRARRKLDDINQAKHYKLPLTPNA
jgi:proteic killer suppression protein